MSDDKRYYWLKLKEDFFEDDTIQWLEEQENGKEYTLFYLKLCLKSLMLDGKIVRIVGEKLIPYDKKALAKATNTDVDTVTIAMNLFVEIGLIEVLKTGEIYMKQIDEMVGSETESAARKRKYRANLEERDNVPKLSHECPKNVQQSIENRDKSIENRDKSIENRDKSIERDKESKTKEKTPTPVKHQYGEFKNVLLTNEEYKKLQERFPNDLQQRIERVSDYVASTGKKYKSHYATIISWAKKDRVKEKPVLTAKKVDNSWERQMEELRME